jgi:cytochrome b
MAGLVAFRLVWGLVGSRYARFASFVRGPAAVLRYLRALRSPRPEHHTGHNPAGALAIVAMLGLALLITASGWAVYNEVGPEWLEEAHELAGNAMLAVVGLHIAGVLLASRLHHENLVGAMVTGRKTGRPDEAIRHAWRTVAALMVVAVLGFWGWQWRAAPMAGTLLDAPAASAQAAGRDKDGD